MKIDTSLANMFEVDGNLNPYRSNFQSIRATFNDGITISFIGDALECKTVVVSGNLKKGDHYVVRTHSKSCRFPWVTKGKLMGYFEAHHKEQWWA